MRAFVQKYFHELLLVCLVFLYIGYFISATFLRYDNFYAGRFDLGNMDQTVWNSANGRIFMSSDSQEGIILSRLASHADFILIFFAPLYWLWPHAKVLLLIQTITVALGAFFVYAIANHLLKQKNISFVLALAYLLNPATQYAVLYDFHAVTLSITFFLGAFYGILVNRLFIFATFAILAGLTKEHAWAAVALLSLYYALKSKERKAKTITIGIFFLASFLFYFLIWHAIPNTRMGKQHFALEYFSELGDSPTNIVSSIIFSPQKVLSAFLTKESSDYFRQLFMPLGFLPIFSPLYVLFASPDILINLLSSNTQLRQIYYQYTPVINAFLFVASIYGVKRLLFWPPKSANFLIIYVLFFAIYSAYTYGPLPLAKNPSVKMFTNMHPDRDFIMQKLANIPEDKIVSATNNLGAHVSHRKIVLNTPYGIGKADYIAILINDAFSLPSKSDQEKMVEDLLKNKNYELQTSRNEFYLFKKR